MVYLKRLVFKTGVSPSPYLQYNYANLTPTQRLSLVRCRIWQSFLNSNMGTGVSAFKIKNKWRTEIDNAQFNLHDVH
jgi:hypothetical protein